MEKKARRYFILVAWLIAWCVMNPWARERELGPVRGESARVIGESLGEVAPKTYPVREKIASAPVRARSKAYVTVDMVLASELRVLDDEVSDVPRRERIEALMRRRDAWVRTFDVGSRAVRFTIEGDDESSYTVNMANAME